MNRVYLGVLTALALALTIACEGGGSEQEQFARAILGCWEAKDADFELNLMERYPEARNLDAAKERFVQDSRDESMEHLEAFHDRRCPPGGAPLPESEPTPSPTSSPTHTPLPRGGPAGRPPPT